MSLERYKIVYTNGVPTRIVEITDANGVLLATPIIYTPSSAGWGTLLSGIASCSESNLEVIQSCLYDNTTGDYLNLVPFVRYTTIDTITGDLTFLGDYQFTASGVDEYTVVGTPILQAGQDVIGSEPHRVVLTGGGTTSWSLATYPQTISLLVRAISGTPDVTDSVGTTPMFTSEEMYFYAATDGAGILVGTLQIAVTGAEVAAISWTELTT